LAEPDVSVKNFKNIRVGGMPLIPTAAKLSSGGVKFLQTGPMKKGTGRCLAACWAIQQFDSGQNRPKPV
jgi:hypothetical protein